MLRFPERRIVVHRASVLLCAAALTLGLGACAEMSQIVQAGGGTSQTGESALVRGIKESLELSSVRAADLLSLAGGYQNSARYRIQLPEAVQPLASRLRQFGLGGQIDQIEKLMNQGAERAAVEAKALFVNTVRTMTVSDAAVDWRLVNLGSKSWARIPVLADLMEGASRELVEIQVTGPISSPQVKARTFGAFRDELKRLFQKRKPREMQPTAPS